MFAVSWFITEKNWKLPKYIYTVRHHREIKISELELNVSMWGGKENLLKNIQFL